MLWLRRLGLGALFLVGAALGVLIGLVLFWVSLARKARAVHAEGVVCRAEIIALDEELGAPFVGPALVRLSGAFENQDTKGTDVLGAAIHLLRPDRAFDDRQAPVQDLVFGTFRSFRSAAEDRKDTDVGDYLANHYQSVTPWWVPGQGPVHLALAPPTSAVPRDRAPDRPGRLQMDIESRRARFELTLGLKPVAAIRLVERLPADLPRLRVSMFRCGRGIRPVGLRNGIRATVYPISQLGRRIRGQ